LKRRDLFATNCISNFAFNYVKADRKFAESEETDIIEISSIK